VGRASESNRAIYRTVARAFGIERPVVPRHYDADEKSHIDVATAVNRPQAGVTSYSTLGLSDYPLLQDGEEYPARLEIVSGCDSVVDWFGNVIATAAFNIINDRHFCAPGVVYPNLVARYDDELDMQHVLFVPPFVGGISPRRWSCRTRRWLSCTPCRFPTRSSGTPTRTVPRRWRTCSSGTRSTSSTSSGSP
jgi:hypothetical protein